MRFMTKENATIIRGLFPKVLQCESAPRTNIVGLKYIRIQVEIDIQKPIPSGLRHVIGNKGCWIQCRYKRLAKFCYNCGMIEHAKNQCKHHTFHNQVVDGDMYGPWVRAEADAYTVVSEGTYLRRVKISRGEIFNTFTREVNMDHKDEEAKGKEIDIIESKMEDARARHSNRREGRVTLGRDDPTLLLGIPTKLAEEASLITPPNQPMKLISWNCLNLGRSSAV